MRQKRAKAYRKLMSLYSLTFGFREPYQVLSAYAENASMYEVLIDFVQSTQNFAKHAFHTRSRLGSSSELFCKEMSNLVSGYILK